MLVSNVLPSTSRIKQKLVITRDIWPTPITALSIGTMLLCVTTTSPCASLIGDEVVISWQYPDIGQFVDTETVIVVEGEPEVSCFGVRRAKAAFSSG
jgi:hypothetical protein